MIEQYSGVAKSHHGVIYKAACSDGMPFGLFTSLECAYPNIAGVGHTSLVLVPRRYTLQRNQFVKKLKSHLLISYLNHLVG
jgi:hypothetical protein